MGIGGPTDAPAPEYMVKSGDTLISIAIHHNISWEALAAANGLGEHSVLQIGQLLRIPGQPAAKSADTVAQAESLPRPTWWRRAKQSSPSPNATALPGANSSASTTWTTAPSSKSAKSSPSASNFHMAWPQMDTDRHG
ncbi:MAG: LysM domain-containing protein [Caldilineaceae bacterium]